jgi:hypothetical protein
MSYQVGQILYMCDENKMKIIPLQVVEEITRTSLKNGKEKNYIVMFPDTKKTHVNLSSINHKIFKEINKVEETMIKNATDAIKRMRKAAELLSNSVFKQQQQPPAVISETIQNDAHVQVETNNDIITVDLGNGVKAKMNSSTLEKVANQ